MAKAPFSLSPVQKREAAIGRAIAVLVEILDGFVPASVVGPLEAAKLYDRERKPFAFEDPYTRRGLLDDVTQLFD